LAAFFIFLALIVVWQIYGGEVFTKTRVLIERKDELFGWTEKIWEDKFVWGLDLSLALGGVTAIVSGVLIFLFRTKKKPVE
jgi:hypothetical protein